MGKKILELFSGTQCISNVFRSHGWETFTIDFNEDFADFTDWTVDILEVTADDILEKFGQPDVIWASIPCQAFSVASMYYHWTGGFKAYEPKTDFAHTALKIAKHTIQLIKDLNPKFFFIENPRGLLRKMPFMEEFIQYGVTYCQYNDEFKRMKPTDIFTNGLYLPFRPMCKNGDTCHTPSPRGSWSGGVMAQKNAMERSKIPTELCEHIFEFCNGKYSAVPVQNFTFADKQMDIFDFAY